MTNFEDKPPPAVGAYWIKEEDYPALLKIFDDGDKLPPSWKEWLKIAEEMEQGLKAYGHVVLRVPIDPATFPDWCAAHGMRPGSAGRRKFVAAAVTETIRRSNLTAVPVRPLPPCGPEPQRHEARGPLYTFSRNVPKLPGPRHAAFRADRSSESAVTSL